MEKIYKYPDPQKIQINEADFKLKLREYFDTMVNRFSFFDLFFIIPAWFPVFTSDFRSIIGTSGDKILGFYIAIIFIGNLI